MFENIVADLLTKSLGTYVNNLDASQLKISIWQGDVVLHNLEIKSDALDDLDLPIIVKSGFIGKLTIKADWKHLKSQPVVAELDRIFLLVGPNCSTDFDPIAHEQKELEKKKNALELIENRKAMEREANKTGSSSPSTDAGQPKGFTELLITRIINNVQVIIKNVHIRYEDFESNPNAPFAFGVTLEELSAQSTNNNWEPSFIVDDTKTILHKKIQLSRFSIYADPIALPTPSKPNGDPYLGSLREFANVPNQLSFEMLKRMATEAHPKVPHHYILAPLTLSLQGTLNKNKADLSRPQIQLEATIDAIILRLENQQYRDFLERAAFFSELTRIRNCRRKYWKYRPPSDTPFTGEGRKKWWQYAIKSVIQDLHDKSKPLSWDTLLQRKRDRIEYVKLWKKKQITLLLIASDKSVATFLEQNPAASIYKMTDPESDKLKQFDIRLDLETIVFFRSIAERELEKELPSILSRIQIAQTSAKKSKKKRGWLGGWLASGPTEQETAETKSLIQLSEEEKEELYATIDYNESAEEATEVALPTNYAKVRATLKLGQGSFTLANCSSYDPRKTQEIVSTVFSGITLGFSQFPSSMAATVTLEQVNVHDKITPSTAFPNIIQASVPGSVGKLPKQPNPPPIFSLQFESNPLDSIADTRVRLTLLPLDIYLSKYALDSIGGFFTVHNKDQLRALEDAAMSKLDSIKETTRASLERQLANHSKIDLAVDLHAPSIFIPEDITRNDTQLLWLDLGKLSITSDLRAEELNSSLAQLGSSFVSETGEDTTLSPTSTKFSSSDFPTSEVGDISQGYGSSFDNIDMTKYDHYKIALTKVRCVLASAHTKNDESMASPLLSDLSLNLRIGSSIIPSDTSTPVTLVSGHFPKIALRLDSKMYSNIIQLFASFTASSLPSEEVNTETPPSKPEMQIDKMEPEPTSTTEDALSSASELSSSLIALEKVKKKTNELIAKHDQFFAHCIFDCLEFTLSDSNGKIITLSISSISANYVARAFDFSARLSLGELHIADHVTQETEMDFVASSKWRPSTISENPSMSNSPTTPGTPGSGSQTPKTAKILSRFESSAIQHLSKTTSFDTKTAPESFVSLAKIHSSAALASLTNRQNLINIIVSSFDRQHPNYNNLDMAVEAKFHQLHLNINTDTLARILLFFASSTSDTAPSETTPPLSEPAISPEVTGVTETTNQPNVAALTNKRVLKYANPKIITMQVRASMNSISITLSNSSTQIVRFGMTETKFDFMQYITGSLNVAGVLGNLYIKWKAPHSDILTGDVNPNLAPGIPLQVGTSKCHILPQYCDILKISSGKVVKFAFHTYSIEDGDGYPGHDINLTFRMGSVRICFLGLFLSDLFAFLDAIPTTEPIPPPEKVDTSSNTHTNVKNIPKTQSADSASKPSDPEVDIAPIAPQTKIKIDAIIHQPLLIIPVSGSSHECISLSLGTFIAVSAFGEPKPRTKLNTLWIPENSNVLQGPPHETNQITASLLKIGCRTGTFSNLTAHYSEIDRKMDSSSVFPQENTANIGSLGFGANGSGGESQSPFKTTPLLNDLDMIATITQSLSINSRSPSNIVAVEITDISIDLKSTQYLQILDTLDKNISQMSAHEVSSASSDNPYDIPQYDIPNDEASTSTPSGSDMTDGGISGKTPGARSTLLSSSQRAARVAATSATAEARSKAASRISGSQALERLKRGHPEFATSDLPDLFPSLSVSAHLSRIKLDLWSDNNSKLASFEIAELKLSMTSRSSLTIDNLVLLARDAGFDSIIDDSAALIPRKPISVTDVTFSIQSVLMLDSRPNSSNQFKRIISPVSHVGYEFLKVNYHAGAAGDTSIVAEINNLRLTCVFDFIFALSDFFSGSNDSETETETKSTQIQETDTDHKIEEPNITPPTPPAVRTLIRLIIKTPEFQLIEDPTVGSSKIISLTFSSISADFLSGYSSVREAETSGGIVPLSISAKMMGMSLFMGSYNSTSSSDPNQTKLNVSSFIIQPFDLSTKLSMSFLPPNSRTLKPGMKLKPNELGATNTKISLEIHPKLSINICYQVLNTLLIISTNLSKTTTINPSEGEGLQPDTNTQSLPPIQSNIDSGDTTDPSPQDNSESTLPQVSLPWWCNSEVVSIMPCRFELTLVDDSLGSNHYNPIVRLSIPSLKGKITSYSSLSVTSSELLDPLNMNPKDVKTLDPVTQRAFQLYSPVERFSARLEMQMRIDYFSSSHFVWEPFLEPFTLTVGAYQAASGTLNSLISTNGSTINVTFTSALAATLSQTASLWSEMFSGDSSLEYHPFWVINETGVPITVTPTFLKTLSNETESSLSPMKVFPRERTGFSFNEDLAKKTQKAPNRSPSQSSMYFSPKSTKIQEDPRISLSKGIHSIFPRNNKCLAISVPGSANPVKILTGNTGTTSYSYNTSSKSNHTLLAEITMEHGSRIVHIKSPYSIINTSTLPIEVIYSNNPSSTPTPIRLNPRESHYIAISDWNLDSFVKFRVDEPDRNWSKPISLTQFMLPKADLDAFSAKKDYLPIYMKASLFKTESSAAIVFSPPVIFYNRCPCDLKFEILYKSKGHHVPRIPTIVEANSSLPCYGARTEAGCHLRVTRPDSSNSLLQLAHPFLFNDDIIIPEHWQRIIVKVDEKSSNNTHLDIDICVSKTNTRILVFGSPYWIINNSNLGLKFNIFHGIFPTNIKKSFSKNRFSSSFPTPALFSFPPPSSMMQVLQRTPSKENLANQEASESLFSHKVAIQITGLSNVSAPLSLDTIGNSGVLEIGPHSLSLSVSLAPSPSQGPTIKHLLEEFGDQALSSLLSRSSTRVVTIQPRFTMVNRLNKTIHIFPAPQSESILSGSSMTSLNTTSPDHSIVASISTNSPTAFTSRKSKFTFSTSKNNQDPSSIIDIGQLQHTIITIDKRPIRISVKQLPNHVTSVIFDEYETSEIPFSIENNTNMVLHLGQIGISEKLSVKPNSSLSYFWKEPTKKKKLKISMKHSVISSQELETTFELDKLQEFDPISFDFAKTSFVSMNRAQDLEQLVDWNKYPVIESGIKAYIEARGSCRVLVVNPTIMHRPKQKRKTSSKSPKMLISSTNQDKELQNEKMSLGLSVQIGGIGISFVNSDPTEILYLHLAAIDIQFLSSNVNHYLTFRIGDFEFDSCANDTLFPILLAPQLPNSDEPLEDLITIPEIMKSSRQGVSSISLPRSRNSTSSSEASSSSRTTSSSRLKESYLKPAFEISLTLKHAEEKILYFPYFSFLLQSCNFAMEDKFIWSVLAMLSEASNEAVIASKAVTEAKASSIERFKSSGSESTSDDQHQPLESSTSLNKSTTSALGLGRTHPNKQNLEIHGKKANSTSKWAPSLENWANELEIRFPTREEMVASNLNKMYFKIFLLNPLKFNISFASSSESSSEQSNSATDMTFSAISQIFQVIGVTLLNINNAPIRLNALGLTDPFLSANELTSKLVSHYTRLLLPQIFQILGSMDVLGDPVSIFTSVSSGVMDFFVEPAKGLMTSPKQFGVGLAKGSFSLVSNSLFAVFNSSSRIVGTVSKGLAVASFDESYIRQHKRSQIQEPIHVGDGLAQGFTALGKGLWNGVSGLVTQPAKGYKHGGFGGLVKGFGRGLVGVAIKPAVGVTDLVAKTTEGMKNTATWKESKRTHMYRNPRYIPPNGIISPYSTKHAKIQSEYRSIPRDSHSCVAPRDLKFRGGTSNPILKVRGDVFVARFKCLFGSSLNLPACVYLSTYRIAVVSIKSVPGNDVIPNKFQFDIWLSRIVSIVPKGTSLQIFFRSSDEDATKFRDSRAIAKVGNCRSYELRFPTGKVCNEFILLTKLSQQFLLGSLD